MAIPQSKLGSQGFVSSQIGIGCMGMTAFYGDFDRALQEGDSLKAIETALKSGIDHFDTAWIYQSFGKGGGFTIKLKSNFVYISDFLFQEEILPMKSYWGKLSPFMDVLHSKLLLNLGS